MAGFSTRSNLGSDAVTSNAGGASRFPLTESPTGVPIAITTAGTKLHTCASNAMDEVYLWASNYHTSNTAITLSFNSTATDDADSIVLTINNQNGLYLIYPGIPHIGTEIYAKAAANSRINVVGFVVRRFREDPSNARAGYNGSS
jgi:hypothetical protein